MGKNTFHLRGFDEAGLPAVKKKLRRKQVLAWFANLPPCLVAMEACGGSHYRAREFGKQRTALANQICGLLGEYGIVVGYGIGQVRRRIPEIL